MNRSRVKILYATIAALSALLLMVSGALLWEVMRPEEEPLSWEVAANGGLSEQPGTVPAAYLPGRTGVEEGEVTSPFVLVADRLKASVVHIMVEKESNDPFAAQGRDDMYDFFRRFGFKHPNVPQVMGSGSGVIIDKRGYVLTNNHVIDGAREVQVKLSDGSERTANIVGSDPDTDLALLDIGDVDKQHVAPLGDSDAMRIGDWAIAMGHPLGLEWTLSVGVISAKGRKDLKIQGRGPLFQDFIQTDASINYGNSGGPLVNIKGEIIGINTAINSAGNDIGFAIPSNMVKGVVKELLDKGYVTRGYLGMVPAELNPDVKRTLGLDDEIEGVFVRFVQEGTPADNGGLMAGDVILEVEGAVVKEVTDFRVRIANHKPGQELRLRVLREGKEEDLQFTLADRAEATM